MDKQERENRMGERIAQLATDLAIRIERAVTNGNDLKFNYVYGHVYPVEGFVKLLKNNLPDHEGLTFEYERAANGWYRFTVKERT